MPNCVLVMPAFFFLFHHNYFCTFYYNFFKAPSAGWNDQQKAPNFFLHPALWKWHLRIWLFKVLWVFKQTHRRRKQSYGYQKGSGWGDNLGSWDWHVHTTTFKIDNQQGPTVYHKELCSTFCNNLNGKRIWKRMNTYMDTSESLCQQRSV